jgi:hypothetical protein
MYRAPPALVFMRWLAVKSFRGLLHGIHYNTALFAAMLQEAGFAVERFEHATQPDGQSVVDTVPH